MQTRVQTGTLYSGFGHAGLILWVVLGDWLFAPEPAEEITVAQVSIMTEAEFQAMKASVPPPSETPAEEPPEVTAPDPVQPDVPEPEPEPEPAPEPEPEPEPQPEPEPEPDPEPAPEPVPEDLAVALEEQPLPSQATVPRPKPRPADRVAPDPVVTPEDAPTAETPTEATSETPVEDRVDVQDPQEQTVPEDSGDILRTEATEEQDEALGMTASIRPKSRPEAPTAEAPAEEPAEDPVAEPAAAEPVANDAAAIAAAVAEAAAEDTTAESSAETTAPAGPPMSSGEIGDVKSAIGNKWNLGSSSTDALRTTIVVRVEFSPDGKPTSIELVESDGPTDAATETAFSAARRAILRAYQDGGIPFPADKYDTWKVLELVFDPNGMRLR